MHEQECFIIFAFAAFSFLCYGEVVDVHFSKCQDVFYKGSPPEGLDDMPGSAHICQTYNDSVHYATHYSKPHRIPIYSAYRLDKLNCPADQPTRRSSWFIEPELFRANIGKNMKLAGRETDNYKGSQAIMNDYPNTNFDKGHLNPNFYQCDNARVATFTLTNSVPQDPCFNQKIWKQVEETAKAIMTTKCTFPGAKRYFVTGAVPGKRLIPNQGHDKEGDKTREYNRVTVPDVMWTAGCCDSSGAYNPADYNIGFSFAYHGNNVPDSSVVPSSVADLQIELAKLYEPRPKVIDIFVDPCTHSPKKSYDAIKILNELVKRQGLDLLNSVAQSSQSSMPPAKRKYVHTIDNILKTLNLVSLQDWRINNMQFGIWTPRAENQAVRYKLNEYGLSTMLQFRRSATFTQRSGEQHIVGATDHSDKRIHEKTEDPTKSSKNRPYPLDVHSHAIDAWDGIVADADSAPSQTTDERQFFKAGKPVNKVVGTDKIYSQVGTANDDTYTVVLSVRADRYRSAEGDHCRSDHSCDYHGYDYYWCYTNWEDDWDYCCLKSCLFVVETGNDYQQCWAGNVWVECSQRYSMLTVANKPCRADHECGLHGEDYYWCYTDTEDNYEYCCQPWHTCSKHGYSYNWCYRGQEKESKSETCLY